MFFIFFLVKSIRKRKLLQEWISRHICSKKIFEVTQKICSVLNRHNI